MRTDTPAPASAEPRPAAPTTAPAPPPPPAPDRAPDLAAARAAQFRLIGLLAQRWILLETAEGLVLFDPKAAKERILYERLLARQTDSPAVQQLLVPVLLELDPRDHDLLLREAAALAAAGLEVEPFGGNTLQIRSLPASLRVEDPRAFVSAILDELLHESAPGPRFACERVARALAKRAAVATVPRLGEAESLLATLLACDLPYCAPDGRPTLSEIGLREIEKRFHPGK
jgi:DNA mismatch repair protein MutL